MEKLLMLGALRSLNDGYMIYKTGDTAYDIYMEGSPHIVIIFNRLKENGWLHQLPQNPHDCEELERYTLSQEGREAYEQGLDWYFSFPLFKRIGAHVGLVALN